MKKIISLAALLTLVFSTNAQITNKVIYVPCQGFAISAPVASFPVNLFSSENKEEAKKRRQVPVNLTNKTQATQDPISQIKQGLNPSATTVANWDGFDGDYSPADPTGAAGPNHYVQAVNSSYTIYNKTGTILVGPISIANIWPGSIDAGDPIVLYDKYADRWFISQFNDPDKLLIAVSTSSDPASTYYTYTFTPAPGIFPDYPKYSVWSDGYYCTSNLGSPENMAVLDRAKMLVGNPSAGMIAIQLPSVPNMGFFCPLSADADGQLPPFGTACPLFCYEDDTWSTGGSDQLNIFKFTTDWTTPANSTLLLDQSLPTQPINVNFNVNWDDVSQPGTTQKLDAINGVLGFRAQYRRWTNYNTVMVNHSVIVNATTNQVGIRWYELRQDQTTNVWSIFQQSTFAPDAHSRWMGSIAMDDNGSIGLAYALSSATISPSLRYTGRLAADPLGQMTFSENIAVTGSGAQTGGNNRFGDYSQTTIDPDGTTFWHTGMYIGSGQQKTRIFSFQLPTSINIGIKEFVSNTTELSAYQNEHTLIINATRLPNELETLINLFDIEGRELFSKKVIPTNHNLTNTFDISSLPKATYLLRIGNNDFQKVIKIAIQ